MPVAIVNRGPTRADALAAVKLDAPVGEALPALALRLTGAVPGGSKARDDADPAGPAAASVR